MDEVCFFRSNMCVPVNIYVKMLIWLSDGLKELKAFPLDDSYRYGVKVTLTANANPPAKYKWVDQLTNLVHSHSAEVITVGMSETIVGIAYNYIRSKQYVDTMSINILGGKRASHATWIRANKTLIIICNLTWFVYTLLCML